METTKRAFNLSRGFSYDLFLFINKHYNTGNEVLFYNDETKLYEGVISLNTQGAGTLGQQETYLNMQIGNFISMLKKINLYSFNKNINIENERNFYAKKIKI